MKEIIVWVIHTPAGMIGLVAAFVALFANKGGELHKKAGVCFTVSMLIMLVSGFIAATLKESIDDMLLSLLVIYTIFTAWLTAHHKTNEINFLEYTALVWIVFVAITVLFITSNTIEVDVEVNYTYWAVFAIFCAIGDIHNIYTSGLSGPQRIIRHIWRMGFSLIWAVLALVDKIIKIQGANIKDMSEEQLIYIIGVPVIFILTIIIYWIGRIWLFSNKEFIRFSN